MQYIKSLGLATLLTGSVLLTGCDILQSTANGVRDTAVGAGHVVGGAVTTTGTVVKDVGDDITPAKKKAKHHHRKHHHKHHHVKKHQQTNS